MRTVCKYTSVCVDVERHCAITKMINVSLLLLPQLWTDTVTVQTVSEFKYTEERKGENDYKEKKKVGLHTVVFPRLVHLFSQLTSQSTTLSIL